VAEEETETSAEVIMDITEVEEIIKKAVGPKLAENGLKVVDVKFNRQTETLLYEEDSGGLDFVAIAGQASLGIMAVCALLVLKMFSGAKKKAAVAAGQLPAASGGDVGLLPAVAEDSDPLMLRRQIANSLRSNPEQVKQLFSSWLEEKGG
jgi:hypothetical protein